MIWAGPNGDGLFEVAVPAVNHQNDPSAYIKQEILGAAGELWGQSVGRLRDVAVFLALPNNLLDDIRYEVLSGSLLNGSLAGDDVSPILADNPGAARHINVSEMKDFNDSVVGINHDFHNELLTDIDSKSNQEIVSVLKSLLLKVTDTYTQAKDLMKTIKIEFTEPDHDDDKSLDSEGLNRFLDFMTCLTLIQPKSLGEQRIKDHLRECDLDLLKTLSQTDPKRATYLLQQSLESLCRSFNTWHKDMSSKIEAWFSAAVPAYNRVIGNFQQNA